MSEINIHRRIMNIPKLYAYSWYPGEVWLGLNVPQGATVVASCSQVLGIPALVARVKYEMTRTREVNTDE